MNAPELGAEQVAEAGREAVVLDRVDLVDARGLVGARDLVGELGRLTTGGALDRHLTPRAAIQTEVHLSLARCFHLLSSPH